MPEAVAQERRARLLEARDELLRASQARRIGSELVVLVDEADRGRGAVARAETDAPEVDLLAFVEGTSARPGDLLRVQVEATDRESNLICRPLVPAASSIP